MVVVRRPVVRHCLWPISGLPGACCLSVKPILPRHKVISFKLKRSKNHPLKIYKMNLADCEAIPGGYKVPIEGKTYNLYGIEY